MRCGERLWHSLTRAWRGARSAADLAGLIAAYQDAYPGRPVCLVGHFGGGALAIWALEALPEGRSVTAAALLGVALSPTYSLAPAL